MAHDEWIWYRTDHVTNSAFVFLSVSLSKKRFVRYLQTFRFNKILLPIEFNSIYIHYGVFCCILTIFDEKVFSEWNDRLYTCTNEKKPSMKVILLFVANSSVTICFPTSNFSSSDNISLDFTWCVTESRLKTRN